MPEELNGLYDFMLRRNSVDLKDYRADAIFYCQLVSHRAMSIIELYLAINDDLRFSYLHFGDGWETLHKKISCDRLATRVNVHTGGLLEVRSIVVGSKRVAKTRSASLTALLDAWEKADVQFIHRTARTYFLDTAASFDSASNPSIPLEKIKIICFEVTLASKAVLYNLESLAPLNIQLLKHILHSCQECSREQRPSNRENLKSVFGSLLQRGFFSTDSNWTPSTAQCDILRGSTRPLPSTNHRTISYYHLYACLGLWNHTHAEYQLMDSCKDVKYLNLLVDCLLNGTVQIPLHWNDFDRAITLFDLAVENGATPNWQITDVYGESTSMFHEIIYTMKTFHGALQAPYVPSYWKAKIEKWLLQADNATVSQTFGPTISTCSSLFFHPMHRKFCLLGHLSLTDIEPISRAAFPQRLKMRLMAHGAASKQCLLCYRRPQSWRPQIYALSLADFHTIKQALSHTASIMHLNPRWAYIGVIQCPQWSTLPTSVKAVVNDIKARCTQLKSLSEALLYLGKSAESIQRFGAAEEIRLGVLVEKIAFRHWKSWYYGIEDASLQRYQICPENLGWDTPLYLDLTQENTADIFTDWDFDQRPVRRHSGTLQIDQACPCDCAWCVMPDDLD